MTAPSFMEIYGGPPLYVNEQECAALCGISQSDWPRVRAEWRLADPPFPQPDKTTRKYLWPEVKAWVFNRHSFSGRLPEKPDGEEHWP